MNVADTYYKLKLKEIAEEGTFDENPRPKYKDGTPAYSKFITQSVEYYNIAKGEFPIPTLRNTAIKTGIKEIFWIYQKQSNCLKLAREMGINWWEEWNVGDDTIGDRYGATIKKYDLVNKCLKELKEDPFGRRHIMDLWQEESLEGPGLKPCAFMTMWSCRKIGEDIYLDLTLTQRSNDYIMAGYINKIQYVALQMMFAGHLGYKVGKFCHFTQNLHIYDRHYEAAIEILERKSLLEQPQLILKENKNFYDYTIEDFKVIGIDKIKKLESPLEIAV